MLIELMKDLLMTVENYLLAVYSKDPFNVTTASLTIFQAFLGFCSWPGSLCSVGVCACREFVAEGQAKAMTSRDGEAWLGIQASICGCVLPLIHSDSVAIIDVRLLFKDDQRVRVQARHSDAHSVEHLIQERDSEERRTGVSQLVHCRVYTRYTIHTVLHGTVYIADSAGFRYCKKAYSI